MRLVEFNGLAASDASALLRPCLAVDRWVEEVAAGRPYADREALLAAAGTAAAPLTDAEVDAALASHPRLGERAQGMAAEAVLSRSEQAALEVDGDVAARLADGNRAYEARFGRVFLIRAAGRSPGDVLAQLQHRLDNDDRTEAAVVAAELRQIALLRLEGRVSS